MRVVIPMFLFLFVACADEEPIVQRVRAPEGRPAAPIVGIEKTGIVHEVRMVGSLDLGFRFEPADLTIRPGDTVRWINESGLPHNVAFYPDRIPRGAEEVIESIMPSDGKLGPMNGRIMSELGDTFEMDFVNAPVGRYNYFSVVQEVLGMVGTLTVEQ